MKAADGHDKNDNHNQDQARLADGMPSPSPLQTTIVEYDVLDAIGNTKQAQQVLAEYMEAGAPPPSSWQRTLCCGSSRHIYCESCCTLLFPPEEVPEEFDFPLPFDIHIILDDRRASSTGVQLMSIRKGHNKDEEPNSQQQGVQVFDVDRGEVPCYDDQVEGTYLLLPGNDSVPISSVANHPATRISTLVVLDCKWKKANAELYPSIARLPKICLDCPPDKSFYWRWHNHGPGMISTVEAIYFAAWQITASLEWTLEERKKLASLLWLFRLQRCMIESKFEKNQVRGVNPHVPFSEEAKAFSRSLRNQKKTLQ